MVHGTGFRDVMSKHERFGRDERCCADGNEQDYWLLTSTFIEQKIRVI